MCPCPPLLKFVFVVRGQNNVPGNKYFSKSKSQSCHNRVLERASASLALDDADGLLLLLTFCIAEVREIELLKHGRLKLLIASKVQVRSNDPLSSSVGPDLKLNY